MYARSTTVHARPGSVDAGIAHVRDEVMPTVLGMPGCVGMSMLADRTSGRCIVTTAWADAAALSTCGHHAEAYRERAARIFGGPARVDEWEIAVLHRDHRSGPGAWVRVTWVRLPPDDVDGAVELFRTAVLPEAQAVDGFCSASLMIDRRRGAGVASVTFDSHDAMACTRRRAAALRAPRAREAGVEIVDVGEFELVLAHLHVPEMV